MAFRDLWRLRNLINHLAAPRGLSDYSFFQDRKVSGRLVASQATTYLSVKKNSQKIFSKTLQLARDIIQ